VSLPYLSEIRILSFNFPPKGWALGNGQIMAIAQNQALFALLGTTYGGDGVTTFALPNLQARVPLSFGPGYELGQSGGEQAHTLTTDSPIAAHNYLGQPHNNLMPHLTLHFCIALQGIFPSRG
jgi:microcystin-dependent protein